MEKNTGLIPLTDNYFAIEVAKHIFKIVWEKGNEGRVLWMISTFPGINNQRRITLPNDRSYSIIGKGDELKEKDWRKIVKKNEEYNGIWIYYDYVAGRALHTATESGLSLLKSKGLNPSTSLIIKCK